jgi:hypothetical protein
VTKTRKIRKTKTADWRFLAGLVLVILVVSGGIFYYAVRMETPSPRQSENNDPTPPYFLSPAAALPLLKTDKPSSFTNKFVVAAYSAANEIPEVLAQQPCFCYCKRRGHRSLLDCFATKHAADCDICVREAIFALQEHKQGKSAEQIRTEIMDGAWKSIQVTN